MTIYCKDCKHVRNRIGDATWWECELTKTVRLTDGKERYDPCSMTRATVGQCGPDAKWFTARVDG